MSRIVTAAASRRGLALPNGKVLSSGQSTVLSDAHFAQVSALVSAGDLIDGGATAASPDVLTPGELIVHTHTLSQLSDATTVGRDVAAAANAAAARAAIGAVLPRVAYQFPVAAGVQTVRTGTQRIYNDTGRTLTIVAVRATLLTAPTGAAFIADVDKNGVTLFTTQTNRPTIAISTLTATAAAVQVTAWAPGEWLTYNVEQIGSTVAGSDLTITVIAEG